MARAINGRNESRFMSMRFLRVHKQPPSSLRTKPAAVVEEFGNWSNEPGQSQGAPRTVSGSPMTPRSLTWSRAQPSHSVSLRYSSRAAASTVGRIRACGKSFRSAPNARSRMALMSPMAVAKSPPFAAHGHGPQQVQARQVNDGHIERIACCRTASLCGTPHWTRSNHRGHRRN